MIRNLFVPSSRLAASLVLSAGLLLFAAQPRLQSVQNVYLLPMTSGLDQVLASRLASKGVFQIVTDPKKADAILTDRIGKAFEDKLAQLYPPPPPPPPSEEKEADKKKSDDKKVEDPGEAAAPFSDMKPDNTPRMGSSSWGRGRGNIFLVERGSGDVIWSMNSQPKDSSPSTMAKLADRIAGQLAKDRQASK